MIDILIAEDEPAILEPLNFILQRAGWRTAFVADGEAVVRAVRDLRPRLLVLDVMLPRRSGLEALKELRADPPPQGYVPVLILTARGQSYDRQIAMELKADGFITKPFANDEVVAEARRLLSPGPSSGPASDPPADSRSGPAAER